MCAITSEDELSDVGEARIELKQESVVSDVLIQFRSYS